MSHLAPFFHLLVRMNVWPVDLGFANLVAHYEV
ncbi:hypothetical protein OCEANICA350_11001 [Oceanicaulis sp. 350]|nr:hypothetical protein OCEANICA350_11001 [Oceanicaulis sp. 350]